MIDHPEIDHPDAATTDLLSLRNLTYGASPIAVDLLERAMKVFPNAAFRQVYSATGLAASGTFLTLRITPKAPGCAPPAGPLANTEIRIVDARAPSWGWARSVRSSLAECS